MDFNSGVCDLYSLNCGFRSLKGKASIGKPVNKHYSLRPCQGKFRQATWPKKWRPCVK